MLVSLEIVLDVYSCLSREVTLLDKVQPCCADRHACCLPSALIAVYAAQPHLSQLLVVLPVAFGSAGVVIASNGGASRCSSIRLLGWPWSNAQALLHVSACRNATCFDILTRRTASSVGSCLPQLTAVPYCKYTALRSLTLATFAGSLPCV